MAIKTIAVGGGNWSAGGTWVGGVAPTAADDVICTALSGNVTIDTTTCVAKTVDFTSYVGTLTVTAAKILTVSGNVTLIAAMTITGTGNLNLNAAATLTSNGKTFSGSITLIGTGLTYTLADNWTVTGTLLSNNSLTCNGNIFTVGGLTIVGTITGTTAIKMSGGTWQHTGSSAQKLDVALELAGNVTVSGTVYKGAGTFLYTSGTITWTSSTLTIVASLTLTLGTQQPFNITVGSTSTITLSANLTITGTFTATSNTTITSFKLLCPALVATGIVSGTADIEFNGAGSGWSGAGTVANNIIFNCTSTSVTGTVNKNGASSTITYTAGTITTTGSTLAVTADITFNTNGMSWNNISPTGTRTITINSLLTVTGTWTVVATTTFAGTSGWSIATLTCTTAGVTITMKNGVTYTTNTAITMTATNATRIVFTSDDATIKAIWTLNNGATQAMTYVNGTRIDSSLGQTIWSFGGTLTSTINWNLGTQPAATSFGFSS